MGLSRVIEFPYQILDLVASFFGNASRRATNVVKFIDRTYFLLNIHCSRVNVAYTGLATNSSTLFNSGPAPLNC